MSEILSRTLHHRGRIVTLETVRRRLPNGCESDLEVVGHPGGAAMVAINDRQEVCVLRQYRGAVGEWIWELPAGKLEPGEPALETARRELVEETGFSAGRWDDLGWVWASPGVFTEKLYLYLARDLSPAQAALEEGEVLEVHWVPMAEAVARALSGEYNDAKTVIGLWRAAYRLAEAE